MLTFDKIHQTKLGRVEQDNGECHASKALFYINVIGNA